jgi:uncharacterized protein
MQRVEWTYRGRWALVTGASAGIGVAFARQLARRGMNLVLAARREDRLRTLAAEVEAEHGVRTHVIPADLGRDGAAHALWAGTTDGRDIHLLVNNAGFGLKGAFDELDLERQAEMVRVNCIAPLELSHLALGHMRGRGGGIVNVASVAGFQPVPLMATYAATKAFLLAFSEALTEEARERDVRVVVVNPGPVMTEFQSVAGTAVRDGGPGLRSPDQVVEAALAGLEGGRRTVTPGFFNRVMTTAARIAPHGMVIRSARAAMTKLR